MNISKLGISVLVVWMLVSLYFGISGLCKLYIEEQTDKLDAKKEELQKISLNRSVDGLPPFTNQYDYQYYMIISGYQKIFPLVYTIPSFLGLILTAMFFGSIGAIINIVLRIVNESYTSNDQIKYISEPLLGLFTGLCVLGISYVLPTILVSKSDTIRPITLMFFSLFFGIYSKKFFEKLNTLFPKFFKS